jgi:hypothetical protein
MADVGEPHVAVAAPAALIQPVSISFHKSTKEKAMLHLDSNEFSCTNVNIMSCLDACLD